MVKLRLVRLNLSATGSGFCLVLVPGLPTSIIQVPGNWIPNSLKGIVRFPGSPGIVRSSTFNVTSAIPWDKVKGKIMHLCMLVDFATVAS